jgi:2-iminobutanoate/2-iminopropanoate deaminase
MPRRAINSRGYHVPVDGFSQMVAAPARGTFLFVSGLTARTADGSIVHVGDYAGQTRQVLENMRTILAEAGATLDDVVQIHTYLRDIEQWPAVQSVWEELWGPVYPASTAVQISRLWDERQLIEMEAVALVDREL